MTTNSAFIIEHELLGELTLKDNDGKVKVTEILCKGIDYLVGKNLISNEEQIYYKDLLARTQVNYTSSDLGLIINYQVEQNVKSGEINKIIIIMNENVYPHIQPIRVIDYILNLLCSLLVQSKHPKDNSNTSWLKYAEVLLPQDDVLQEKFRYDALEYFSNISDEQIEIFKKMYGSDWKDIMVEDYAQVAADEWDNDSIYTIEGFVGDQLYHYEHGDY